MIHAVVMAGGAGTRFWPASRQDRPKQLLDLAGDESMIQATVHRFRDWVPPARTLIVTNSRIVDSIRSQLPELPPHCVVGEPCKRDTAPCVGFAAAWVAHYDPDATMIVTPADHVIQPTSAFRDAMERAVAWVDAHPESLVTFGIRPTYPAESFGYIQRGAPLAGAPPQSFEVQRFREKPSAAVAAEYVANGNYYWNSGIFVWKAQTILSLLEQFEPEIARHIRQIATAIGQPNFHDVFTAEFAAIVGKSIDYAVMERAPHVAVLEAPFTWDDVGSWQAFARLRGTDEQGNTLVGRHLALDTRGSIVRSTSNHLVVTLGLDDILVVHTPDATLVANKRDEERIREVVKRLQESGGEAYL